MRLAESAKLLHVNPLVALVNDALTAAQCQEIIDFVRASKQMTRATVVKNDYSLEVSKSRTNSNAYFPPTANPHFAGLFLKLARIMGMPASHAEGVAVLHYAPGQEFSAHPDGFKMDGAPDAMAKINAAGGQRLFTTILYLNHVEEGGGTTFPKLGFGVNPRPGRLLIFANTAAGSHDPVPEALHAGAPVVKGEKWAATIWWRQFPYKAENNPQ